MLAIGGRRVPVTLRPDDGDLAILYEIFVRDAYRIDDRDLNPASVRVVIDAGANIGVASLYLAARYPNARIVSIEPNPDNLALLRANAAGEPRITIVQACLMGLPNQQVFIDTAGRGSHFQANTSGRGVAVPGISIQQLSAAERLGRIDLLKIDIEGGEKDVFAHPAFLSDVSAVIAELHPGYDLANFTRDLVPFGFKARASEFARDPNVVIAVR
ncbi:MAG: FkbM family methyltransferase [Hyphomicrobium sp.]